MKPADVSAICKIPFVQNALPIIIGSWRDGKRIDEAVKRLDGMNAALSNFAQRIVRLEERTSPLAR